MPEELVEPVFSDIDLGIKEHSAEYLANIVEQVEAPFLPFLIV
jgi:hypothetical protein